MLGQEDLLTQKIELILEMNGKKLLSEVTKLREEISSLKEEVAGLKKATRFGSGAPEPVERQPVREAPQQQWQQASQQQQWQSAAPSREPVQHPWAAQREREAQQAAAAPQKRMDQPIDRNNVAPDQVNIEKMFYFGNKR